MDQDDLLQKERPPTPVSPAIAYPSHLLYAPGEWWGLNGVLSSLLAFAWGIADGTGVRVEGGAVLFAALHMVGAWLYRKNPFFMREAKAYFAGKPRAAFYGSRNHGISFRRKTRFE